MSIRHHKQIRSQGWTIEEFNGGCHVRINGVIDVWPDVLKYMPSRVPQKARHYVDINQLRRIVKEAEAAKPAAKAAPVVEQKPKQPIKPMTQDEWFRRFA